MAIRSAFLLSLGAISAVACGGAVFGSGDPGEGGSSSGASGGSSSAGKPSKAGSSSKAGTTSTGGVGTSGSTSTGGSVGVAGSVSMGGGPNCEAVDCPDPVCANGSMPVRVPGQCCPTCSPEPSSCDGVQCKPVMSCDMGYTLEQPAGACCEGCVPNPGGVACPKIACPAGNQCPLGYIRGDEMGGCCTDCVPDPLFCNADDDCAIADRPRPCCGCPEAISMREYLADECWSLVAMPRMLPPECQPAFVCDAICSPCPPPGKAVCSNHRCLELGGQ